LILEAQMAAVPGFLLRLNTETGRLLQHQDRQGRPTRHWQVVLLLPEEQLPDCSQQIRTETAGTSLDAEIDDVIAAIMVSRFSGRIVPEICAMGGITGDEFTSSVAYREIFGLGRQEGRQEGRQTEAVGISLRLLEHRCGSLTPNQQARIQALSLSELETLLVALLDFQGPDDLNAWLNRHAS
jgi:hypothetical protein